MKNKKGCACVVLKLNLKLISFKTRTFPAIAMTTQSMRINSTSPLWLNSYDSTQDNGITLLLFALNSLAVLMVNVVNPKTNI